MELAAFTPRRLAQRLTIGIDGPLLALSLALAAVGLATLFSASYENPGRVTAQVANLAVALAAMWLMAQVP
ncbi:MAG TPA: rod shape-determining protein RodA, partial [Burkholderiaceae bacterium]